MSQNSNDKFICGCPKDYYQQKLAKCEAWEARKKEKLEQIVAGDKCAGMCQATTPDQCKDRVCTKMDGDIFAPCSECHEIAVNEYGDEKPHICQKKDKENPSRERERETFWTISNPTILNQLL